MVDQTRRHHERPAIAVGPVVAWLAVQLLALVVSASRVPLSARFPRPAEELAAHVMLVAQVTAAALLFPLLLRDPRMLAVAALTALPFLQLAGHLAGTPTPRLAQAAAFVIAWLVGLALWRRALPTSAAATHGVAVAAALALGGPVLWYIRAEFSRRAGVVDWSVDGMLGPTMGALAQLEQRAIAAGPWLMLGAFTVAGGATWLGRAARREGARSRPSG